MAKLAASRENGINGIMRNVMKCRAVSAGMVARQKPDEAHNRKARRRQYLVARERRQNVNGSVVARYKARIGSTAVACVKLK